MSRIVEKDLTFESLHELDGGRIAKLLERHLANISRDCMNRPADDGKRKVTLDFVAKPIRDPETGECEHVQMEIECKSRVPLYRSKSFQMRVHHSGFLFNQDFPDDLDQQPLFDQEDGE